MRRAHRRDHRSSRRFTKDGVPAERAAAIIAEAIPTGKPESRYTIGRDAAIIVRVARLAPDRLLDRMLRRNLEAHYPSPTAATTEPATPG